MSRHLFSVEVLTDSDSEVKYLPCEDDRYTNYTESDGTSVKSGGGTSRHNGGVHKAAASGNSEVCLIV